MVVFLQPSHLDVINESFMHNVPRGSETHFKVVVVSNRFDQESLLKRHRLINEVLQEELQGSVHALSIQVSDLITLLLISCHAGMSNNLGQVTCHIQHPLFTSLVFSTCRPRHPYSGPRMHLQHSHLLAWVEWPGKKHNTLKEDDLEIVQPL